MNQWFVVTEVKKHMYAIREPYHFEDVVSYLVVGRHKAILVDTGMGYANMSAVVRTVTALPVTVLLTHAHWDHIGGASGFTDIRVFDDPFEQKLLRRGFHSKDISELWKPGNFSGPWKRHEYKVQPCTRYRVLDDGDVIPFDGDVISVIHTPGHTPGSVCFLFRNRNMLATGDTMYPGPLYAQMQESDVAAYAASVKKLAAMVNDNTFILPGHNATSSKPALIRSVADGFGQVLRGTSNGKKEAGTIIHAFGAFSILTKA